MQDAGRRFGKQTPLRALSAENYRALPCKRVWPTSGLRMARVWHSSRHLRPVPHAQKADPLTRLSARSDRSARGHSWPWFPISRAGRCGQMARLNGNQSSITALARGLGVLQIRQSSGALTLVGLHRLTGIPKASLLRMSKILMQAGDECRPCRWLNRPVGWTGKAAWSKGPRRSLTR